MGFNKRLPETGPLAVVKDTKYLKMKVQNPFVELKYSVWIDKESLKRIAEIEEIDKKIEFLDNIKVGNNGKV